MVLKGKQVPFQPQFSPYKEKMGTPGKHQKQAEALKKKAFTQWIKTSLSLQLPPPTTTHPCQRMPPDAWNTRRVRNPSSAPSPLSWLHLCGSGKHCDAKQHEGGSGFLASNSRRHSSFRKPRQERTQAVSHAASTVKSRERSLHFPFLLACCSSKFLQSYTVPGRGHNMVIPTIDWVLPQQLTIKKVPPQT